MASRVELRPHPLLNPTPAEQSTSCYPVPKGRIHGYDWNVYVSITPTERARYAARFTNSMWSQLWQCTPYPSGLHGWQGDGLYDQLACHAIFSARVPGVTGWAGGPTWDLESWRPNESYDYMLQAPRHSCNWS